MEVRVIAMEAIVIAMMMIMNQVMIQLQAKAKNKTKQKTAFSSYITLKQPAINARKGKTSELESDQVENTM